MKLIISRYSRRIKDQVIHHLLIAESTYGDKGGNDNNDQRYGKLHVLSGDNEL